MSNKFRFSIRTIVLLSLLIVFTGALSTNVSAVVKLRSQISPGCATTSSTKYADIYADGNIAVMGSYSCRGVFIFDISNPDAPVLSSWYSFRSKG
jgi:hypothetical protein